jgi:UDP-N-acetylmuramate--alanine ligase
MAIVDLSRRRRIHLIGVGGPGINPLASVLADMGHQVSGSDLKESAGLDRLRVAGVQVFVGNSPEHVGDVELVGRSTAVPDHNVEVREARRRGIPVHSRGDVLAGICACKRTVAVGGTHGKTTTTAMLALALVEAGLDPSYLVGGDVNEIGSGAVWDAAGELFVVEADESDGTYLQLGADAVVVTNIELDHLDHFADLDAIVAGFAEFCRTATTAVVCLDDPGSRRLAGMVPAIGYGTADDADYRIVDISPAGVGSDFAVVRPTGERIAVHLPVPGVHNVRNATAALALAVELGAEPDAVVAALGRFAGVARRFEFRGEAGGVLFVDDYAHLASEVRATIAAAASLQRPRLVAVFQQHRYRRVEWFWQDLAEAFDEADVAVIVEPAPGFEESPPPGVSGMLVVRGILDRNPHQQVAYVPDRDALRRYLLATLRPGDLCLVMQAAGALTDLPEELMPLLAERELGRAG